MLKKSLLAYHPKEMRFCFAPFSAMWTSPVGKEWVEREASGQTSREHPDKEGRI